MVDRFRQPLFGPWSVLDVMAAFTVLLSPLLVLVLVWAAVEDVMDRERWWPVIALGRLALVLVLLSGVRTSYRQISRGPAGVGRPGEPGGSGPADRDR